MRSAGTVQTAASRSTSDRHAADLARASGRQDGELQRLGAEAFLAAQIAHERADLANRQGLVVFDLGHLLSFRELGVEVAPSRPPGCRQRGIPDPSPSPAPTPCGRARG
jgi:hypothetical protein